MNHHLTKQVIIDKLKDDDDLNERSIIMNNDVI